MTHPYVEYESSALWDAIVAALSELEANTDITLTTARSYVVGYLCRALTRAGVVVKGSNHSVPVIFNSDEALILFELLARGGDAGAIVIEHPAEEQVLWRLEGALERQLAAPFDADFAEQLAAARERIIGRS